MNLINERILLIFLSSLLLVSCRNSKDNSTLQKQETSKTEIIKNPIHKGYYADPSVIQHGDRFFIYATIDPWGGDSLAVLETKNFQKFKTHKLNWPTKKACTSPTSKDAMVWAPGVTKGKNGKFYMYISVGSEIWVGESETPLGPWKNAKEDGSPLIKSSLYPDYHMIDAHCFIDSDGQAYLYWGSGWDWVNGRCFAVKLKDDMVNFDGEIKDVTPPNYFEAPYILKKNNRYYLMYSDGKAIDSTYKIRYSVSDNPLGPFEEGVNSPIATTNAEKKIYGPGHHSVFTKNGQYYILYHQIKPQEKDYVLRQLRLDSLNFTQDGEIEKINFKGVATFSE
ncbi:family 43 glycosylhydrolase [Christiangramia crocea]|uniref:Family 43 glycosylhydrolase n=1 Tax=Christiangramia crocea TaxID=2904124 RepID=A0A9X1UYX4_9FLAO|nr:family 43 glycosylhydrolase [Gramella crocea]MCG9972860.1 family 43 glycosylhydrolase [Gramella crocea]